jgi:phosphatidate cytidylyltransferase
MTNTQSRIISALVLVTLVIVSAYLGKKAMLLFCLVAGLVSIDEILVNFCKSVRNSFNYLYVQFLFFISFVVINFVFDLYFTKAFFTVVSIFFNLFLMYYLFRIPLNDSFMRKSNERFQGLLSILIFFPLLSFGIHFQHNDWKQILCILMMVTFSMDTGAWFFGRKFGKHKLWPAVSPNKTVEGLIGGMFLASIMGSLTWYLFFHELKWESSVIFAICGAISQVGDLIQSKIKREFQIKDSSNLIPGHGGVYDRIDSLIFLSPFFVVVVKYLGHQAIN